MLQHILEHLFVYFLYMKKLIICEKPSLAKNVCQALWKMGEKTVRNQQGADESTSYIVTSAFGHLFTLCDVEDYLGVEKTNWKDISLPFYPDEFKFQPKADPKTGKPDSGVKDRIRLIKQLAERNDVDSIIHCGDSDREGEIIIRIILDQIKNKKPVYRLWLPDQVEKTIIAALHNLKSDSDYDNLSKEGYARMYMDWLYGINLTRYTTIKSGYLLHVGRVVGAIVKTIYDREIEIEKFVPEKYLSLVSKEKTNDEEIELVSKTKYKPDEYSNAANQCALYNNTGAKVTDIKTENKKLFSPKLFSQSTLQNTMSKRYKFDPKKTLDIAQTLYEKGFLTYPRTPTEYLATAEKDRIKEIIENIKNTGKDIVFKDKKSIFDDSKIESHSAITPTIKLPEEKDFSSNDEKFLYETVLNRFCSVFCREECNAEKTTMVISVGDLENFNLVGTVILTKGWKQFEPQQSSDEKILPKLKIGEKVNINFHPVTMQTEPPKHYTVETLNKYLKNPFKQEIKSSEENESDDEEYKALLSGLEIGTEATRPGIIDKAVHAKYIDLQKTTYYLQPRGRQLVETMEVLGIDMTKQKTVMLGKTIKNVYKGEIKLEEAIDIAKNEINDVIDKDADVSAVKKYENKNNEIIGRCPWCKSHNVVETPKTFTCEDRECGFTIWKDNNFFKAFDKKGGVTKSFVKAIITKNEAKVTGLTSKRTGKKFDAYIGVEKDPDSGKLRFKILHF